MSTDKERWVNWVIEHTKSNRIHWRQEHGGWVAFYGEYLISVRRLPRNPFENFSLFIISNRLECKAFDEVVQPLWDVVQEYGPKSGSIGARIRRLFSGH